MVLRKFGVKNATVHGFRSSFRDWAGNVSSFPREVVETAPSRPTAAAMRWRRKLMDAWAAYCEPKTSANVVQMRK
jgi:hypothetical protein